MSHKSDLIEKDIEAYLAEHERKDLLRFLTCGSVDDGKSTLIGRLLHDSKMIYEDQLKKLHDDSETMGSAGEELDLSLLMDGLKAEREQGITIDVAYRYFSTSRRKFIIADTPGHEQYTRNMVTGASNCHLAIILVDARHGVLPQTKRHSYIASLLGIEHIVVAINKMDLVDWSKDRFEEIRSDYLAIADRLGISDPHFIPMSALKGDWVVEPSDNISWYDGVPLMEYLETVDISRKVDEDDFRMPVQLVSRPDLTFRGFQGTVASGVVKPGDSIVVLPSGVTTSVDQIVTFEGELAEAKAGQAVTLTLADEVDVSRGDVIVHPGDLPQRGHDLDAMVVWMSDDEMVPGKEYLIRQGTSQANASVSSVRHRVDINSLDEVPAPTLGLNDIARCMVTVDKELVFEAYSKNRVMGAFLLVDKLTNASVAAGMISGTGSGWDSVPNEHLERQQSRIELSERQARYGQVGCTVFFTGLTGAGKSTLATALERVLFDRGRATVRLDGENMRLGVSRDLGFSSQERSENVRRTAEVARLVNDQGLITIAALVAPKATVRQRARDLIGAERFVEVFVDTPIDVCRDRDDAGLYAAADEGEIPQFPGVSATYDRPEDADLVLDTVSDDLATSIDKVITLLSERGFLRPPRNGA